jgi:tetratricopeptide (TPR) repeat protein
MLAIIGTALILAGAAVLHPAFGAERVFGIYKPVEMHNLRHIAPLLNANHLAAYINIGFCLALGIALDRRAPKLRPIAVAIALLLAATQVWVASRGGSVAMVFGAVCVFLMARSSRRFATRMSSSLILPGVAVAAGLAMFVFGSSQDAASEINSTDVSKIGLAMSALPLALHFPLFGVGRGAFEVAFPAVRQTTDLGFSGYLNLQYPENLFVQWLTEWGIPAALIGLVALTVALRPKVLVASSPRSIGAWAAIATTAVHNLVDFNSEVPAIGIAVTTCAAILVSGRGKPRTGWIHGWASHPRTIALAIGAAAALSIAIVLLGWPHEVVEDRADLYAMVERPELSDDFPRLARDALRRHPSEAYIPFIASVDASRRRRSVIPWVERTLTIAPIYGPAHFMLAEELKNQWPAQARLEYRLAITQDRGLTTRALTDAIPLVHDFDDALEIAPENTAGRVQVLDAIAQAINARLPATRERLDELIRQLDPDNIGPLDRVVNDVLVDLDANKAAPWCEDRVACAQPGIAAVRIVAAHEPGKCAPHITRARLEVAVDEAATALRDLQEAAQTASDPSECWHALGELALTSKNDAYVSLAEDAMARTGCTDDAECANNLVWVASIEERRGNYRRAMGYYEHAQEKAPERRDIIEHSAQLASSLEMHAQALEAYRKLSRLSPQTEKWHQLADREKTLLFHEAAP